MKFFCLACEHYMSFDGTENLDRGALGVFFRCPRCRSRFAMVTNSGETQLVTSLGVRLGGATEGPAPLEFTRSSLATSPGNGTAGHGGCPFAKAAPAAEASSGPAVALRWTPEAETRMSRVPDFVRPMARQAVERLARERGLAEVTVELLDEVKSRSMG